MPNDTTSTSNPQLAEARLAAVAIGRNEGVRLERCLASLKEHFPCIVYVDSGSTDGSVAHARSIGVHVVELDLSVPFTAARARNAGLAAARASSPKLAFVQFVDGDCEIARDWVSNALATIEAHPRMAVVCGRRRERHPERTPYNQLCDIEWDTPVGPAEACGGDSLMRVEALAEVGGFDETLIAGEEPELCFRLRQGNWHIERIGCDMTLHDADMHRFGQWWKRTQRAGHAFAEHALLHGRSPERMGVRQTASNVAWTGALAASVLLPPLAPLTAAAAGVSAYRIFRRQRAQGRDAKQAWLYAANCLGGKVPQAMGAAQLAWRRLRGQASTLIEYK